MAKRRIKSITEDRAGEGFCEGSSILRKITASTIYGTCTERLSPFGDLWGSIKFLVGA